MHGWRCARGAREAGCVGEACCDHGVQAGKQQAATVKREQQDVGSLVFNSFVFMQARPTLLRRPARPEAPRRPAPPAVCMSA